MPNLLRRAFRGVKRKIKQQKKHGRSLRLFEAARRLLAEGDHERVSVANIAREAGMSVGAFYERFLSKDHFLNALIADRFRRATADAERTLGALAGRPPEAVARAIAEHVVITMHGAGIGIVRTALKRGAEAKYPDGLVVYREAVSERAVALLITAVQSHHNARQAVLTAVQLVQAAALDAVLYDRGPLRVGRHRTVDALTRVMVATLGLDGAAFEEGDDDETAGDKPLSMPIEDLVAMEPPSTLRPRRRQPHDASERSKLRPAKPAVLKAPKKPLKADSQKPLGRRNLRFI